ncbi:MAG TPA: SprT family zinc-dependent metalloprotease [Melioribacteraceae bacterium]|nr:SprT family zinc-dependent metalloprotease [Melioribacteraceae bacterium]
MLDQLQLTLTRSARKTLSIYIERDGSITVHAPKNLPLAKVEEVLKKKEYRIYKVWTEQRILNESHRNREFVSGQSFLYLGRSYALKLIDTIEEPLVLKNGRFYLRKSEKVKAKEHFVNFYKTNGFPKIIKRIEDYKKKLGVSPNKVRIIDIQNRWASCTQEGNLNFHWKCIMAPYAVLNYIVVHELVHLKIKNHTKAFWNEVDKLIPNYLDKVDWLKKNGAGMDL